MTLGSTKSSKINALPLLKLSDSLSDELSDSDSEISLSLDTSISSKPHIKIKKQINLYGTLLFKHESTNDLDIS